MTAQVRPLVTFALLTYNQELFIKEAIEGALAQTYEPLEIIISDDCSTDKTFEIAKDVVSNYKGPHKLWLNKNTKNHGIGAHINLINRMSMGELIVAAAGDDISMPNRVSKIANRSMENNEILYYHSSVIRFYGRDSSLWEPRLKNKQTIIDFLDSDFLVIGATEAWNKKLFDVFGEIHPGNMFEDMCLCFRAALLNRICYIDEPLVLHRIGYGVTTGEIKGDRLLRNCKKHLYRIYQWKKDAKKIGRDELVARIEKNRLRFYYITAIFKKNTRAFNAVKLGIIAAWRYNDISFLKYMLRFLVNNARQNHP